MGSLIKLWWQRNRLAVGYGVCGFGAAVLCTLFSLFNVALFTDVVGLDASYFYTGHIIYAGWNAINDPAFGWIVDSYPNAIERRIPVLKYCGPAWCLGFMLLWYPPSSDGASVLAFAHFLLAMISYDGFLTYVLIVKCALLADITSDEAERNRMNFANTSFELVGSVIASATFYLWDPANLVPFRIASWILACLSAITWYVSGTLLDGCALLQSKKNTSPSWATGSGEETGLLEAAAAEEREGSRRELTPTTLEYGKRLQDETTTASDVSHQRDIDNSSNYNNNNVFEATWAGLRRWTRFARELLEMRSFCTFVAFQFVSSLSGHMGSNFLVHLDRILMRQEMPTWAWRWTSAACLYLPRLGVQAMTPMVARYGVATVVRGAVTVEIMACAACLVTGRRAWAVWGPMLVVVKLAQSSAGFFDLLVADIIDEDRIRHNRTGSRAAGVHGVHSLFVKPAGSVAAVVGVAMLRAHGLRGIEQEGLGSGGAGKLVQHEVGGDRATSDAATVVSGTRNSANRNDDLESAIFCLTFGVTLVCAVVQFGVWVNYDLRGQKLARIKRALHDFAEGGEE